MRDMKTSNSNSYRAMLQQNGENILKNITTTNERQHICKGTQFYRVDDINDYFTTKHMENLNKK
jgi:hypothetical protein